MKVKELIKKLEYINPNLEIIMSTDSEGNNYSKLYNVAGGQGDEDVFFFEREIYDVEDKPDEAIQCIVLFPS